MSDPVAEAITYLREVHRGTTRAERVEVLVAAIEDLQAERQAVLDVINIYGDEILHSALDDIGFVPRRSSGSEERP